MPDYACLIIGANMGVVGMCKEHMGVALALKAGDLSPPPPLSSTRQFGRNLLTIIGPHTSLKSH